MGAAHTPGEIWRQPELWPDSAARAAICLTQARESLLSALADERARVILTGAGSSHFIGDCLLPDLRKATGRVVMSVATTDLATAPELLSGPGPLVLVSFARSGDSPESLGVYRLARRVAPSAHHVAITCNARGALAQAAEADRHVCVVLDPAANDRGLAMTGSFTNMVVAGLGLAYLDDLARYHREASALVRPGRELLHEMPALVAASIAGGFERIVFLGTGAMYGAARESSLKVLEMTDGAVPSLAQTYLDIRHGPLSFVSERTLLVALRSGDPYARRYEADLIAQLIGKGFRHGLLIFEPTEEGTDCPAVIRPRMDRASPPDALLAVLATLVGQTLALLSSRARGCRPDQPSARGIIARVVEGVVMHDEEWPGSPA